MNLKNTIKCPACLGRRPASVPALESCKVCNGTGRHQCRFHRTGSVPEPWECKSCGRRSEFMRKRGLYLAKESPAREDLRARLQAVVDELSDTEVERLGPDLAEVLRWMAHSDRRYTQSATDEHGQRSRIYGGVFGDTLSVPPGLSRPHTRYFVIFEPEPYK